MKRVSEPQTDEQSARPAEPEPLAIRMITDVNDLRAMADPTRLAILFTLMEARYGELPVLSAKDLAAQLNQPQTKLYRHLRQLESAGLIRVAATRVVSGILEQRYQACQRDLEFGTGFLRQHAEESEPVVAAMLSNFREGFFAAFRDKSRADAPLESEAYRRPKFFVLDTRVTADVAAQIRSSLGDLLDQLSKLATEDPDGVLVHVLTAYYRDADEPGQVTAGQA
jgi:DNA-binding transcriptional ArsR family regulator